LAVGQDRAIDFFGDVGQALEPGNFGVEVMHLMLLLVDLRFVAPLGLQTELGPGPTIGIPIVD
jgi:hypothetical protein